MKLSTRKLTFIMITLILTLFFTIAYGKSSNENNKPELKFNKDGSFKIVQFADPQDGPNIDLRTIDLMNKILDDEKPNLVVLTGDNINGIDCTSSEEVKKAIDNIAQPMEKRQIPWAIVFGNHDEESGKMNKKEMMNTYMSYAYNLSQPGPSSIDGIGNYNLLIKDSKGKHPIFNIYLLDSGAYAPINFGKYDWIKKSQIDWYSNTSSELKKKYKKTIPSLMFFHIPLPEFRVAWEMGNAIGSRNEEEWPPKYNSGLFGRLVETKDVLGVFVGHDHTNDYVAELNGIKLGYSGNIGFRNQDKKKHSKGARVFLIKENTPWKFNTWMDYE